MERSAEQYSLHEPISAPARTTALSDDASQRAPPSQHEDIEGVCANPLRDEPHPAVVGAVKRFGLVALVACALGAGMLRWWKSLAR